MSILTDDELINAWLDWKLYNQGRADGTVSKYRQYIQRLADFLGQHDRLLISADYDALRQFAGEHAFKVLRMTPRARRPLVACIRGFYEWAHDNGHIASNPAKRLEYPRTGRALPKALMLGDAEKLLMQPDLCTFCGVRDVAMLATLFGTGLRVSGLVRMNESDLMFYQDTTGMDRLAIRVSEKGGHERFLPVPDDTMLLIRAYLGHEDMRQIDRNLEDGDRVLWVSVRNRTVPLHDYYGEARRITAWSIDNMLKRYGRAAGIQEDRLHAHAARHLYGTEMMEDDVDLITLSQLMGHSSTDTTKIYTGTALRRLQRAVDKSNPLAKIRTPATGLRKLLEKSP